MQRSEGVDSSPSGSPLPIVEGLSPQTAPSPPPTATPRETSPSSTPAIGIESALSEGELTSARSAMEETGSTDLPALGIATSSCKTGLATSPAPRTDTREVGPDFTLSGLPPPQPWELDFVFREFEAVYLRPSIRNTASGVPAATGLPEEPVHSQWHETPALTFRILFHPINPDSGNGRRLTIGCFVELTRKEDYPEDWAFLQSCRFYIYAVNPRDLRRSAYRADCFSFSCEASDRGWHQFLSYDEIVHESFVHKGDLYFRAGCTPLCAAVSRRLRHSAALQSISSQDAATSSYRGAVPSVLGRAGRGYVGLKNHGATCYMNALLQSLYFIGKFRQAVYALNFDARSAKSSCSREILERRRKRRHALRSEKNATARLHPNPQANGAVLEEDDDILMEVEDAAPSVLSCPAGSSSDSGSDLSDLDDEALRTLLAEEEAERSSVPSISMALQNVFLRLYTSYEAVPCKELIHSFGWGTAEALTQQDTHELLKLLLDKVEEQTAAAAASEKTPATDTTGKAKSPDSAKNGEAAADVSVQRSDASAAQSTEAEADGGGCVKSMFEGEMETYVQCLNVDYSSRRKEAFQDINLDVRGCAGVRESLQKLIAPEMLEGDNLYDAEEHGRQRAKKGVRFLRFPPVCVFLLKRFDFDFEKMETVKVFDRFEFERELDLSEFCEGAGVYVLHSVSVHQGDVNSGHYYCFIRPPPGDQWVRFDDDKVYPVSEYAAIGDNFGGEEVECFNYLRGERKPRSRTKPYNAYILVYVAKSESSKLLADNSPLANPEIVARSKAEERLKRLRFRARLILEKSVRVKVYHPLQFKYRRFLELPISSVTPLLEFKRTRDTRIYPLHEAITTELRRLLYGGGASTAGGSGPRVSVHFSLHLLNTHMASPRFERLELGDNPSLGLIQKKLLAESRLDARLDACMHILAVPVCPTVFYDAQQHDEHLRGCSLFFIKYFQNADPVGTLPAASCGRRSPCGDCNHHQHHQNEQQQQALKNSEEDRVICLDVVTVPSEVRPVDLEGHVCRLLLQAIKDGRVNEPAGRVEELKAWASQLPSDLPPLSSCAPFSAPLEVPLVSLAKSEGSTFTLECPVGAASAVNAASGIRPPPSFSLSCCLELDAHDKMESAKLKPRKSLSQMHVYSGDLLVFSVDLPESVRQQREAQSSIGRRPEDLTPQEVYTALSSEAEGHATLERMHRQWKPGAPPGAARGSPGVCGRTLERTSPTFSAVQEQLAAARAASGGVLPPLLAFMPRKRGGDIPPAPPLLPTFSCEDFVEYLAQLQAREVYQVRLYDPVETLNAVTASCGRLLSTPSFRPFPSDSPPLPSEPSGASLPVSEGGTVTASVDFATTSLESGGASNESSCVSVSGGGTVGGCGVGEDEDSQQPLPEDPWLHAPRGRPVVVREFLLDNRTPCKQALLWIAWQLGVDPCRLAVYPEPPLLSDKHVELADVDAFISSVCTNAGATPHSTSSGELSSSQSSASAGDHPLTLAEMCSQGRHSTQAFRAGGGLGSLDRRRVLLAGNGGLSALGLSSRPPLELHLALLPRPARLCTRTIDGSLLSQSLLLQLQRELLHPLPPAALLGGCPAQSSIGGSGLMRSSNSGVGPSSAPLLHTVLPYYVQVFSRQAECLCCVAALIPAFGLDGAPMTARHLILDVAKRLPLNAANVLKSDFAAVVASSRPASSESSASVSSPRQTGRAGSTSPVDCSTGLEDGGSPDAEENALTAALGPLRLVLADSRHFRSIAPDEPLLALPLYTPSSQSFYATLLFSASSINTKHGTDALFGEMGISRLLRFLGNERAETISNLIATPLRIEPAWTKDELELVERGERKVLLVVHQTPGEREPFGHPFEILVEPSATISAIRSQVRKKCLLPKSAWSAPIFFQAADTTRSWKGANDTLDWEKYSDITLISSFVCSSEVETQLLSKQFVGRGRGFGQRKDLFLLHVVGSSEALLHRLSERSAQLLRTVEAG